MYSVTKTIFSLQNYISFTFWKTTYLIRIASHSIFHYKWRKIREPKKHTKNEWITRIPIIHVLPNHAKEYDFIYPLVIILIFLLNKIHTLKKKQWIYLKNDFQGKLKFLRVNILTDRETKTNDHNHFKIPELTISNDDTKWWTNIKTKHRTLPIEHF